MIVVKSSSARKPRLLARAGSNARGQPATMRAIVSFGSRRISRVAASPAIRLRASICSPTVTETPGRVSVRRFAEQRRVEFGRAQEKLHRRAGRSVPVAHVVADGQDRLLARQRLPDDPGKKSGSRLVRRAGPHADGREPEADPVEKAAPRIVGQQQLANRLLRSVARQRRRREVVADHVGKGGAEHGDRRGEDEARPVDAAGQRIFAPNGFEQGAGSVEIDRVALVEIRLRLARHDGGEEEDHVGPRAGELGADVRGRDVEGLAVDREGGRERVRRDDIDEARPVDRLSRQSPVARQPLRELAPDHSCRADDEDVHGSATFPAAPARPRSTVTAM